MKRLRKQGPNPIVRIFALLLVVLATGFGLGPALSQPLNFVSVAWVSDGKQPQYDQFNDLVVPIWARHGMEVLLRARVVGALSQDDQFVLPSEIAVLHVASRQQFQNYIADPQYQSIRQLRMEAVDQMIVLEGTDVDTPDDPILQTAPQFLAVFSSNPDGALSQQAVFELDVTLSGSIKGSVPAQLTSPINVMLFALSYDDNPMTFLNLIEGAATVVLLEKINNQ